VVYLGARRWWSARIKRHAKHVWRSKNMDNENKELMDTMPSGVDGFQKPPAIVPVRSGGNPGQGEAFPELCRTPKSGPGSICGDPGCGKVLPVGVRKDAEHCDRACWRNHERYDRVQRIKARIPNALEYARKNPSVISKIAEWIKDDVKTLEFIGYANRHIRFRYYWERFIYEEWIRGNFIHSNDHFERTVKKLLLTRFPELKKYVRMKGVD
jgi:hypothetical protein